MLPCGRKSEFLKIRAIFFFFFYLQERGEKNEIQRLVADAKLNSFNNKHQFDMSGVLKKASRVFNATLSWSLLSNQT